MGAAVPRQWVRVEIIRVIPPFTVLSLFHYWVETSMELVRPNIGGCCQLCLKIMAVMLANMLPICQKLYVPCPHSALGALGEWHSSTVFQMKKFRSREAKQFAEGHIACTHWIRDGRQP